MINQRHWGYVIGAGVVLLVALWLMLANLQPTPPQPASGSDEPNVESVTYPVTFTAEYQALGEFPGMHVDIEIRTATSVFSDSLPTGRQFTVFVLDGPPWQWRLKGLWYLASGGTSDTNVIDAGLQVVGDIGEVIQAPDPRCWPQREQGECTITGDNRIDSLDFSRLTRWFGREKPVTGPEITLYSLADFNADNRVDIWDYSMLRQNYGLSGFEFGP